MSERASGAHIHPRTHARTDQPEHGRHMSSCELSGSRKPRRFSEATVRVWVAEICLALGYLHQIGVAFRDLKPENVLLDGEILMSL